MPLPELPDKLLPEATPDGRPRRAGVSAGRGTYPHIPHQETLAELRRRCEPRSVEDLPEGSYLEVEFEG